MTLTGSDRRGGDRSGSRLGGEGSGGPPPEEPPSAPAGEGGGAPPAGQDERTRTERFSSEGWSPGARVAGKYEVVGLLGSGGFGTVYKVRHVFRKKYYALKVPHLQFVKDPIFKKRFEREIEAMERFVHPDAVMIRDCGVTEYGVPYYTMDFIEGESLKAVLQRERRLPPARALRIVRRIIRVLEVAHEHRIIHRDIKPDNVLLSVEGGREQVRVLDFGVAKLLDLVEWTSITREGRVGTPRYMSPEQITGEEIDARSDLFSLGVIFYEMVTGEHPFARDHDPIRVAASILNRTPLPPRELAPDLPRQLSDRILWMIEKRRKRRPASAQALLLALPEMEPERGHAPSGTEPVQVFPGAPRAQVRGLVLRQETSSGDRRVFIVFKERVAFGRSSESPAGPNDLVFRCLPCRSAEADPENWRRNLTISQRVGAISPDGPHVVIEPERGAGLAIGGVRSPRPVRIQTDRFHLSLGDRALEIDGFRRLRSAEERGPDPGLLAALAAGPSPSIGYSNPACAIDHVHLRRANNHPLHEYFIVYRRLTIGSAAGAGLRLTEAGVEGEHAVLIHEGGEAFVGVLEGGVRIARSGARSGSREETVLPPAFLYPLTPGIELLIAGARLRVDALTAESYKEV